MISIKECNPDLDFTKKKHIDFVVRHVSRVINFYIRIFELLIELQSSPRLSNTIINKRISQIKLDTKSNDYKALLQSLLNGTTQARIANVNQVFKIKNRQYWRKSMNNPAQKLKTLKLLSNNYLRLIEIDFENNSGSKRFYNSSVRSYTSIRFLLNKIFDYENWFSNLKPSDEWGPYQLTKNLNLDCCPYCNRQYTFTIVDTKNGKVARPELDHFLPKNSDPLLALSFYNLIPSCHVCNSNLKGAIPTAYDSHLSPYEQNDGHSLMRFTYLPTTYEGSVGISDDLVIDLKYNGNPSNRILKTKVEGNIKLFFLKELYANHKDVVQEIIWKRELSGDDYIKMLQTAFPAFPINVQEAYRLSFGNYHDEKEFSKRVLSKLTKDIAIELGKLIKY